MINKVFHQYCSLKYLKAINYVFSQTKVATLVFYFGVISVEKMNQSIDLLSWLVVSNTV